MAKAFSGFYEPFTRLERFELLEPLVAPKLGKLDLNGTVSVSVDKIFAYPSLDVAHVGISPGWRRPVRHKAHSVLPPLRRSESRGAALPAMEELGCGSWAVSAQPEQCRQLPWRRSRANSASFADRTEGVRGQRHSMASRSRRHSVVVPALSRCRQGPEVSAREHVGTAVDGLRTAVEEAKADCQAALCEGTMSVDVIPSPAWRVLPGEEISTFEVDLDDDDAEEVVAHDAAESIVGSGMEDFLMDSDWDDDSDADDYVDTIFEC
mmetsp:Transcript_15440/g.34023  ORF Transcript_15440/g.34023 Transcript_15440/m.34023 type:complete len:265 (+) Transcript_15440:65-859(+)|eukprot:CAMPEP_0170603918 /NCGR_PEP_ID=MMETSP0224-20130122/19157_1 /TAXON_ID=285029 /ORGANISM="Togula jolla, Strain CCCM 725" /LENGTH=264 /DNA_ID=CAMNT_0010928809 /DNA_START=60 /DNA_END=854 /DNA_ORIENTATION=-